MTRCQYDGGVLAWSDRQYASMEAGHVEVCPSRHDPPVPALRPPAPPASVHARDWTAGRGNREAQQARAAARRR